MTRIYDAELRGTGLRSTQHSLLRLLGTVGEVCQGELGELASLEETTLTRNLRPLEKAGWLAICPGSDRRQKRISLTEAGRLKVEEARPAWLRAQERMRASLPAGTWDSLFAGLPAVLQTTALLHSEGDP